MAAGPLCPASSHNCHTSCASINLLSLVLQHNFIKTTQERANNKPAQLSGAKDRTIRPQKNGLGFRDASVKQLKQNLVRFEAGSAKQALLQRHNKCSLERSWNCCCCRVHWHSLSNLNVYGSSSLSGTDYCFTPLQKLVGNVVYWAHFGLS